MADLMQQARELLAVEYEREGRAYLAHSVRTKHAPSETAAIAAIAAALRAAPEGGVPERTMMALATGWRRHAASGGRGRAVLIQCAESLEAAVIAARPQGVKDA